MSYPTGVLVLGGLVKRYLLVSLASCLVSPLLIAQIQNARIEGTVLDNSGAVVPGAKLSIVNTRTQVHFEGEANPEGFYFFPTLQPGFYTLSAEAVGFRKTTVNSIEVNTGAILRQDVKLELGTVTDTIMVESSSVRIQTTEARVHLALLPRDSR